jgi:hypothetical protein
MKWNIFINLPNPSGRFSFKKLFNYPHEAEGIPFQADYSENLVAPGIEPETIWYSREYEH